MRTNSFLCVGSMCWENRSFDLYLYQWTHNAHTRILLLAFVVILRLPRRSLRMLKGRKHHKRGGNVIGTLSKNERTKIESAFFTLSAEHQFCVIHSPNGKIKTFSVCYSNPDNQPISVQKVIRSEQNVYFHSLKDLERFNYIWNS